MEKDAIEYAGLFALEHLAIDDAMFERLRRHFDEGEIFELTVTIGRFLAFGRLTRVLELDAATCSLPED